MRAFCEQVICLAHRGSIVGLNVERESDVGQSGFLARFRVKRNHGPFREIEVGARLVFNVDGSNLLEGLRVFGLDRRDTFLEQVKNDDGLGQR